MAYTAQTLITRSWYLSGIVARNLQTPTGDQITEGLMLLNALLAWKGIQIKLIPYWTYNTSYTAVAGQEAYFIENCVAIESVTFNIDVVRYAMDSTSRQQYFASTRVDNISSLPFNWNFNRSKGGGTLYMYFLPAGSYPLKIMGKFGFDEVTLQTDMSLVYDNSYIEYLRYALADYMCSEYGVEMAPRSLELYKRIEHMLMNVEPPDLTTKKSTILADAAGLNYGDVNIGHGWRPS